MWKDVRVTEEVDYGDQGLPKRIGSLCSVPDYRARFTDLATRGWSSINLHAVGLLDGVLILHLERPAAPPAGSKRTSVNMSGASKAVADRSYKLDGLVDGGILPPPPSSPPSFYFPFSPSSPHLALERGCP